MGGHETGGAWSKTGGLCAPQPGPKTATDLLPCKMTKKLISKCFMVKLDLFSHIIQNHINDLDLQATQYFSTKLPIIF